MAKSRKLYQLSSRDFLLPLYIDPTNSKPYPINASNIPMVTWPDGRWCLEANLYMVRLYQGHYSRTHRGGSLLVYATHISHLIRYCYISKLSFFDISNSHFTMFMHGLRNELSHSSSMKHARSNTQVIKIGRKCLEFLKFISSMTADSDLVGEHGRVLVSTRPNKNTRRSSRFEASEHLYHSSFPKPDPVRIKFPISDHATAAVRASVRISTNNSFIRARRNLMLRMLESLGGRRTELVNQIIPDIDAALREQENMISLLTVKKRGDRHAVRMVPITSEDLALIKQYIKINRAPVIKRTCGFHKDTGHLFISAKTGYKLTANTITSEIHLLSKHAKLTEPVSPHLYRHRYITKIFIFYLEFYNTNATNNFASLARYIETVKAKVKEYTGHTHVSSLDHYVNLAFEEANFFQDVKDKLLASTTLDNFRTEILKLRLELDNGLDPATATSEAISIFERTSKFLSQS